MQEQNNAVPAAPAPKVFRLNRLLMMGMALASLMAVSASAVGETGGGSLAPVITATATVGELMTSVLTMITSNALLVVFLAVGLLSVGITAFKKLKGAAK